MNRLEEFFYSNEDKIIHKASFYFDMYHRHFEKFCGTDAHVVELGVAQGGSMDMWKYYFGSKSKIYGIDCNPYCKQLENEQVTILTGDINDKEFQKYILRTIPKIDIFIDDGCHHVDDQISVLKWVLPHISHNGVYLCEDISYNEVYGGGYLKKGTFLEYAKEFLDYVQGTLHLYGKQIYKHLYSMCVYDAVVVIEKRHPYYRKAVVSGVKELDYSYEIKEDVTKCQEAINKWEETKRKLK